LSKLDYIGAGGLTITPKTSKFDILPIKFAIKIWGKLLQVFVGWSNLTPALTWKFHRYHYRNMGLWLPKISQNVDFFVI